MENQSIQELSRHPGLKILSIEPILKTEIYGNDEPKDFWKNKSLLARSEILHQALSFLDEETTVEEFDLIAETEDRLKEKLVSSGYISQKYDQAAELILSEAQSLKGQIEALQKRAEVFSNRAARRRDAMLKVMLEHNIKKVETPALTMTARTKAARVFEIVVDAVDQLPTEYIRIKKEADKRKILEDLKLGKQIPGYLLSQNEFTLLIR